MNRMSPQARRTARDLALTVPVGLVITVASVYLMQTTPMPGRALIGAASLIAMVSLGMLPSYVRERFARGCPLPETNQRILAVAGIVAVTVGPISAVVAYLVRGLPYWAGAGAMLAVSIIASVVGFVVTGYLRRHFPRASERVQKST